MNESYLKVPEVEEVKEPTPKVSGSLMSRLLGLTGTPAKPKESVTIV